MKINSATKQNVTQKQAVNNNDGGKSISLPPVPVLQNNKEEHTLKQNFYQTKNVHFPVTQTKLTQSKPFQLKENKTGMPDDLKAGVENLSGMDMSDVKVHYNSSQPAQMQALAYAQGNEIHIGPGQEKHLPHEAWHVVQQRQGRVKPTLQMKQGVAMNDDPGLEHEADVMGEKALSSIVQQVPIYNSGTNYNSINATLQQKSNCDVVQRKPDWLNKLIEIASNNPITSLVTAGVSAASLLAYYYWRGQAVIPPPIQAQQQVPDRTTLEGVAAQIKVEPEALRVQLETGVGEIDISQFYDVNLIPWQDDAIIGAVPPTLIENLPQDNQEKVTEIFNRLNAWPFTYTGTRGNGVSGFLSRQGDCYSLAAMFKLANEAAGIKNVGIESRMVSMLVESRPIHGRVDVQNVDGVPFWNFVEHHWCIYNGQVYDLLFMTNQIVPASLSVELGKHNGINYQVFQNNMALIPADQAIPVTLERQGVVVAANNVITYIDENIQH